MEVLAQNVVEHLSPTGQGLCNRPFISRDEAEVLSKEIGAPVKSGYLQKLACVGGGPPYRIFGRTALMVPSEFIEWLLSRVSQPSTNTSATGTPEVSDQPLQGTGKRVAGGRSQ